MNAKNRKKIQPLDHISGLALRKKLRFCTIRSKNQNKSRLSQNKSRFLIFFRLKRAKSQSMNWTWVQMSQW